MPYTHCPSDSSFHCFCFVARYPTYDDGVRAPPLDEADVCCQIEEVNENWFIHFRIFRSSLDRTVDAVIHYDNHDEGMAEENRIVCGRVGGRRSPKESLPDREHVAAGS